MKEKTKKCAVTGSNGYLGSRVVKFFRDSGWSVIELRRLHGDLEGQELVSFELGGELESSRLRDLDCLIHCAYDFCPLEWDAIRRINVEGSNKLFQVAAEAGVKRIVFISSISAFKGCASLYGKAKLEAEELASKFGAVCVRPGLIFGEQPGGMVGSLGRLLEKIPILPVVGASQALYQCHEEDLGELLIRLAKTPKRQEDSPITAANPEPKKFSEILRILASRKGKSVIFLPFPWRVLWILLRGVEKLTGRSAGFRSDSLMSLMNPNPNPDFSQHRDLGVTFRPFEEARGF